MYILFLKIGYVERFERDAKVVFAAQVSRTLYAESQSAWGGASFRKAYNLYIRNPDGSKIEIDEFLDQRKGTKELNRISKLLGLPSENKILEAQQASLKRRSEKYR